VQIYQLNNKIKLLTHNDYVQQTSCNQINKQTDIEKEIDNVTDNKDDRRIHRKVFICKKKNYNKLLTHVGYQIKTAV
jgi:TolA-binding protein